MRLLRGLTGLICVALVAGGVGYSAWAVLRVQTDGYKVTQITIASRYVHANLPVTLVTPPGGGAGRPLLIFLHGRGGDQDSELSTQFFSAMRALGARGFDVAFPDGGDHSYWYNRASGDWGSYVLKEVLPTALRVLQADPHRLAIGGISMGGFGAYDLARVRPGMFCAVGGHSAAIWPAAGDTAPGAFDNAADFDHNNLIGFAARAGRRLFPGAALWLDGGSADPFHPYDEQFAHELGITMHVWPGGHDFDYWNAHWGSYLGFYAAAFANCRH